MSCGCPEACRTARSDSLALLIIVAPAKLMDDRFDLERKLMNQKRQVRPFPCLYKYWPQLFSPISRAGTAISFLCYLMGVPMNLLNSNLYGRKAHIYSPGRTGRFPPAAAGFIINYLAADSIVRHFFICGQMDPFDSGGRNT